MYKKFTSLGQRDGKLRTSMSDKQRNQLIAHILALTLIVDKYCVRYGELCKDLGLKSRVVSDTYRSMGCSVNKLKGDQNKGQMVAVLKLPVKLPPLILRKGGRKKGD